MAFTVSALMARTAMERSEVFMSYRTVAEAVSKPLGVLLLVLLVPIVAGADTSADAPFLIAQAPATQDHAKAIAAADTEVLVARDALDEARRRFEAGRKASSADRVNQLEGGSHYTDAYYLRVEQLKADVTKAQGRLDSALKARKALGE
jgi:hypothetical protein